MQRWHGPNTTSLNADFERISDLVAVRTEGNRLNLVSPLAQVGKVAKQHALQMRPVLKGQIFCNLTMPNQLWKGMDFSVVVRGNEIGHRKPFRTAIDNPMGGRFQDAIAPSFEHVADFHDVDTVINGKVYPAVLLCHYLQSLVARM